MRVCHAAQSSSRSWVRLPPMNAATTDLTLPSGAIYPSDAEYDAAGLACDNLWSAEVVLASGDVVRAGGAGDQELLWGLRGGGGNFGVVTSFEFRLTPLDSVFGGMALFEMARAHEVIAFYREWVQTIPAELPPMLVFLE